MDIRIFVYFRDLGSDSFQRTRSMLNSGTRVVTPVGSSCQIKEINKRPKQLFSSQILHRQHHTHYSILACTITSILAMSSRNFAILGLVLVPIVIAVSAAYIALKCAELLKRIGRYIYRFWDAYYPWSNTNIARRRRDRRRRDKQSDLSFSVPIRADSWTDLESLSTEREYYTSSGESPRHQSARPAFARTGGAKVYHNDPGQVWHPTRSARLMWSFTNPRSPSRARSESLSVARPSPAAHRPESLSGEDAALLANPTKVWEHRREATDP